MSCHYLLLNSFHSLLTGLMAFILDTLYTHGSQSDDMKAEVGSHHSPSLSPSVAPLILKLKSKHLSTPHKAPYDLVPAKAFDLSPTSLVLTHYVPSSQASCCSFNSCSVFLPQDLYSCCSLCLEYFFRFQHGCTPSLLQWHSDLYSNVNSSESHSLVIFMTLSTTWNYTECPKEMYIDFEWL